MKINRLLRKFCFSINWLQKNSEDVHSDRNYEGNDIRIDWYLAISSDLEGVGRAEGTLSIADGEEREQNCKKQAMICHI
jgi:hypothetical protein